MTTELFRSLDAAAIARKIRAAQYSVCYAAPGIQLEPAQAMSEVGERIGPDLITVCLDFDERVMRMGYGDLAAVKTLRDAGVVVRTISGLRIGLLIVDQEGYVFTPTALYLESDQRSAEAPNALRLSRDQALDALTRLSPAAKAIAIALARTDEERERIRRQAVEIPSEPVTKDEFATVAQRLDEVPPVQFDVARQVRVFNAYLQYVDMKLSGAAIQRHRLAIPPSIQKLGSSADLAGRLRTTFDLIEKEGSLSSKVLEEALNEIRKHFTPSLGKDHGRVILKAVKPIFQQRLDEFQENLKKHQENVERDLQIHLDRSREQIVDHYLPQVVANPPDALVGQFPEITKETAKAWLNRQVSRVFPLAEALVQKMQLDVRYKDMTFETLNQKEFLEHVKKAFPDIDWEKAYNEFRAAGESGG